MQVGREEDLGHLSLHERLADLALEPDHVPSHDRLSEVAVAGQDSLQQIHVLIDGLAQPHLTVEHQVPEAQAQVEVALEGRLEKRVSRGAVEGAVNSLVELHEVALVGDIATREQLDQLRKRLAIGAAQLLGRQPRGVGFDDDPHLGDARQVGDVDVSDERPSMRYGLDEILAGQALQRLPDRRPPDLQLLAQPRLVDDGPWRHLQAHDALEDAGVSLLALRTDRDRFGDRHLPTSLPYLAICDRYTGAERSTGRVSRQLEGWAASSIHRSGLSERSTSSARSHRPV